jgi:hypothetical protein
MRPIRKLPLLAVLASGLLALAGCTERTPVHPGTLPPLDVVAAAAAVNVQVHVRVPYAVSVIARVADRDADLADPRHFDVKRCFPSTIGECWAAFSLIPGLRYVFSAEPLRVDDPQDHLVWANRRPVPVYEDFLPGIEGTVFVHDDLPGAGYDQGSSLRKIDENLDLAYARARPLPERAPTITIEPRVDAVRVNACTGVPDGTYVFGAVLFDAGRWSNIPVVATPDYPAIAQYAARYRANAPAPCMLVTSEDRTVILKGYNFVSDQVFSGSLDAFSREPANLTPDAAYVIQHYIPDPLGDGNPDSDYMTFGLLSDASDHLHWKVNSRGLVGTGQKESVWEFVLHFRSSAVGFAASLRITVACNRDGSGACALDRVVPAKLAGMLIRNPEDPDEFGRVDPVTGAGYLQVLLEASGIHSARLRASTIDTKSAGERPGDFVPNVGLTVGYLNILDGYVHWTRADDLRRGRSRSMFIPF